MVVRPLELKNLVEEVQDYIAANSGLGYVVGTNFLAENTLQVHDLERLLSPAFSDIKLSIHDEQGSLEPSGRQTLQTRFLRFVAKDDKHNEALDRARDVLVYLWNLKHIKTATFHVWVRATTRLPQILTRATDGRTLVDFIIECGVLQR